MAAEALCARTPHAFYGLQVTVRLSVKVPPTGTNFRSADVECKVSLSQPKVVLLNAIGFWSATEAFRQTLFPPVPTMY
jgi:hypothetical protein